MRRPRGGLSLANLGDERVHLGAELLDGATVFDHSVCSRTTFGSVTLGGEPAKASSRLSPRATALSKPGFRTSFDGHDEVEVRCIPGFDEPRRFEDDRPRPRGSEVGRVVRRGPETRKKGSNKGVDRRFEVGARRRVREPRRANRGLSTAPPLLRYFAPKCLATAWAPGWPGA